MQKMTGTELAKNILLGNSCQNCNFRGHKFIGGLFCGHDEHRHLGKNPNGELRYTEEMPEENICIYWEGK